MKDRRRRRIDPDRAAAGDPGWYATIPAPGTFTCSSCGEERHFVGQDDGICLRCRWAKRPEARQQQEVVPFPEEGSSG